MCGPRARPGYFFYNSVDARSHLMNGAEDPLGVVGQPFAAVLELLAGLGGVRRAEYVAGGLFRVPPAEPVQALLFLSQLGQGEFAFGDLGVDLRVELPAVRDELRPLRLP